MPSLIKLRAALLGQVRSSEGGSAAMHGPAIIAHASASGSPEPGQRPAGSSLPRCAKDRPIWAQECLSTPRACRGNPRCGWCAATASRNSTMKALSASN